MLVPAMRLSALAASTIVLALAAALPAAAADAPPGRAKTPPPPAENGYVFTLEDAAGTVLGSRSASGPLGRVGFELTSAAGCATVDAWRTKYTLLGFVAYKFHQTKHWCWSYPRITSVDVGAYMSDVDPNYILRGVSGYGWFYTWAGSGQGGHYSYRQAQVENCVLHYGCLGTAYPWVEIWVNGNGAWSANWGG